MEGASMRIARSTNRAYLHGGYMGVAAPMLHSPAWMRLLQAHTPAAATRAAALHRDSGAAMRALENSPVLAAYGVENDADYNAARTAVEWDVYLPRTVEAMVLEHDALGPADEKHRNAVLFRMLDATVVAHGTLWRTLLEGLLGISAYPYLLAFSDGMTINRWMCAFLAARRDAPGASAGTGEGVIEDTPMLSVFLDVKSRHSSPRALALLVRAINRLGVRVWGVGSFSHAQLADISGGGQQQQQQQCVWAPPAPLAQRGIPPLLDHVREGAWEANSGRELACPAAIAFKILTFVADIQRGCDSGSIKAGDAILFNGGSLLTSVVGGDGAVSHHVEPRLLAALELYVRAFDLRLGYYAQEYWLDAAAADALARIANDHPAVFAYGFAYSGLSGLAAEGVVGSAGSPANGLPIPWWANALFAKEWDFKGGKSLCP